jgi:D-3-phosphoglycerate dehydrogenase
VARLAAALGVGCLAFDPYVEPEGAEAHGVRLVDLGQLLRDADFVCVCCPLNDATRHLIGANELAQMKSSAFLINVARGPIVDQGALVAALEHGVIKGAALDVFEREPLAVEDPLVQMPNVILAPHALSWTDDLALGVGTSAITSVIAVANREHPSFVVNPSALQHPRLADWFGPATGGRDHEGE